MREATWNILFLSNSTCHIFHGWGDQLIHVHNIPKLAVLQPNPLFKMQMERISSQDPNFQDLSQQNIILHVSSLLRDARERLCYRHARALRSAGLHACISYWALSRKDKLGFRSCQQHTERSFGQRDSLSAFSLPPSETKKHGEMKSQGWKRNKRGKQ